jgi:hypothetical protein
LGNENRKTLQIGSENPICEAIIEATGLINMRQCVLAKKF